MDPFQILDIPYDSSWSTIKKAYKRIIVQVHPDKLNGDDSLCIAVNNAFRTLKSRFAITKQSKDMPKRKQKYEKLQGLIAPRKMTNFTNQKFNEFFEKNKILNDEFDKGYSCVMTGSTSNREDIEEVKKANINKSKQELVIFREPIGLQSKGLDNYHFMGKEISDFSCASGTDYLQAHSEKAKLIDTATKYENIDDILNSRSKVNSVMTAEEECYKRDHNNMQLKLEQLRLDRVQKKDDNVDSEYMKLNRRIAFK